MNKRRENDLNIVHCRIYAGCRFQSLMLRLTVTITNFFCFLRSSVRVAHWWKQKTNKWIQIGNFVSNKRWNKWIARRYGHEHAEALNTEKIIQNGKCDCWDIFVCRRFVRAFILETRLLWTEFKWASGADRSLDTSRRI